MKKKLTYKFEKTGNTYTIEQGNSLLHFYKNGKLSRICGFSSLFGILEDDDELKGDQQ